MKPSEFSISEVGNVYCVGMDCVVADRIALSRGDELGELSAVLDASLAFRRKDGDVVYVSRGVFYLHDLILESLYIKKKRFFCVWYGFVLCFVGLGWFVSRGSSVSQEQV